MIKIGDSKARWTLGGHVEAALQRHACTPERPFIKQASNQSYAMWNAPRR
jgi:hypothetical protein